MIKKWLIIMSLAIGLSSSSFFLPHYLSYLLTDPDSSVQLTPKVLSQAQLLKLPAFYQYQLKSAVVGSSTWLSASRSLAKTNSVIATELAVFYQEKGNLHRASYWFNQAITLDNDNARLLYARLLIKQQNYQQAFIVLAPIVDKEEAMLLISNIAIVQGDQKQINKLIPQLSQFVKGRQIVAQIVKYQIVDVLPLAKKNNKTHNAKMATSCPADIQMFATNLSDLVYLEQLIDSFATHPLSNSLCFEPIRYISLAELACHHKPLDKAQCDETIWQNKSSTISTRYIGVLLPEGGANVNSGIMYLDNKDTADVLAHEVAHLLGFVDEYPLPSNHAKCAEQQSKPFAHNAVVINSNYNGQRAEIRKQVLKQIPWRAFINDDTPIMHFENNQWQLGTPAEFNAYVGLFASDTCKNSITLSKEGTEVFASYKPLKQQSQLNYFELKFPWQYQKIPYRHQ
jgi:tetratricopeptide (TPR) repeat protein